MLQLPSKTPRFSRAQIADITRGARAKVRVRIDPIIALTARADVALDSYYDAVNAAFTARKKLPKDDQGHHASVYIPDELLNVEWSNGFAFTSSAQIDRQFTLAAERAKQRLQQYERNLGALRAGHGCGNRKIEIEQGISSAKRALKLFRIHREPMKAAFRKEHSRLLKAQNAVGLVVARKEAWARFRTLQKITAQIAESKPYSAAGALATAKYVEARLWCDRPQLFADEGAIPGNFGALMRTALSLLSEGQL
jgi:hypothetical protein